MDRQNNYVIRSNWLLECQNFVQRCSLCVIIIHNYFDSVTRLFSVAKFLATSAKPFFPCIIFIANTIASRSIRGYNSSFLESNWNTPSALSPDCFERKRTYFFADSLRSTRALIETRIKE